MHVMCLDDVKRYKPRDRREYYNRYWCGSRSTRGRNIGGEDKSSRFKTPETLTLLFQTLELKLESSLWCYGSILSLSPLLARGLVHGADYESSPSAFVKLNR